MTRRERIKPVLRRWAERSLRLSKDAAALYDALVPSEYLYGELIREIHDEALEMYYKLLEATK